MSKPKKPTKDAKDANKQKAIANAKNHKEHKASNRASPPAKTPGSPPLIKPDQPPTPPPTFPALGPNIRARRERLGLSQAAAAASAGIRQQYWAEIESGRKEPTLAVLRRVAGVLGVKAGRLLVE